VRRRPLLPRSWWLLLPPEPCSPPYTTGLAEWRARAGSALLRTASGDALRLLVMGGWPAPGPRPAPCASAPKLTALTALLPDPCCCCLIAEEGMGVPAWLADDPAGVVDLLLPLPALPARAGWRRGWPAVRWLPAAPVTPSASGLLPGPLLLLLLLSARAASSGCRRSWASSRLPTSPPSPLALPLLRARRMPLSGLGERDRLCGSLLLLALRDAPAAAEAPGDALLTLSSVNRGSCLPPAAAAAAAAPACAPCSPCIA
jgi:hypothetical protein